MKKLACTLLTLLLALSLSIGCLVSAEVLEHKYVIGNFEITENSAGDPLIKVKTSDASQRFYPDTWQGLDFDGFHFKLTDMSIPAGDGILLAFCLEPGQNGGVVWYDSGNVPFFTIRRSGGVDSFHAINTGNGGAAEIWTGSANPIALTEKITDTIDFYCYKVGDFWYFEINGQIIPMNKAADGTAQAIDDSLLKGHNFEAAEGTICPALGWGLLDQTYVLKEFGVKKAPHALVSEAIDALPATITLADKEAVNKCKTDYEALGEERQALVTDYAKVTAALARIEALEKLYEENKETIDKLIADIDALPASVTLNDETAVNALKARYDALNDDLKGTVTNYNKITAALKTIADLKNPKPNPGTGTTLPFGMAAAVLISGTAVYALRKKKGR